MGGNQSSKSEEGGKKKKKQGRSEEGPDPQQRRRSGVGMVGGGERWGRPAGGCGSRSTCRQRSKTGAGQGSGLGRDWGWLQRKEAGRRDSRRWEVTFNVDIVVGAHEPLILVQVVVVHVLDHHEGLFLGRVGVVHPRQRDDRQGWRGLANSSVGGLLAGKELHAAGNEARPSPLRCQRAAAQVLLRGHHPHVQEIAGSRARGSGAPVPAAVVATPRLAASPVPSRAPILFLWFPFSHRGSGEPRRAFGLASSPPLLQRRWLLPRAAPKTGYPGRCFRQLRPPELLARWGRRLPWPLPSMRLGERLLCAGASGRAAVVGAKAGTASLPLAQLGHSGGDEPGRSGEAQHQPQCHAHPRATGAHGHRGCPGRGRWLSDRGAARGSRFTPTPPPPPRPQPRPLPAAQAPTPDRGRSAPGA